METQTRDAAQDVIIVGAGPAGTSTAVELLENGYKGRVTILEAIRRPNRLDPGLPGAGHSMCSGGLGRYMMDLVRGEGPNSENWEIPKSVVMAPIRRAVLRGPNSRAEIDGSLVGLDGQAVGVVMDRKKLDDWLLGRAIKLGANYVPGARVRRVSRLEGRWNVCINGSLGEADDYRADFLVGADGPESLVARQAFGAPPISDDDIFLASEVYVPRPDDGVFPSDAVELMFQPSRISGYFWCFSAGDVVKTGLGFMRSQVNGSSKFQKKNPADENRWWCERKAAETGRREYLEGYAHPVERVGGRITGAVPLRTVVDPRRKVAVVGEAARAVWASIGAGDASAIESGRALGRSLATGKPTDYQYYWSRNMRPFLKRHHKIKNALLSMSDRQIDRAIGLIGGFRPRSTNTRREVPRLMGYLLRRDPRLLGWAALKAMLP